MPQPSKADAVVGPTDVSMLLLDISGYTQLLYQASKDERTTIRILRGVRGLFSLSEHISSSVQSFSVINTTGDGFLALVGGATPSRTAVECAQIINDKFSHQFRSLLGQLPFRSHLELRIGFHHGPVYSYELPLDGKPTKFYNSDSLNLLSRVTSSGTARRFGMACTRDFVSRLLLGAVDEPDEVVFDKNVYPEPVEVFRLPEHIPDYEVRR